MLLRKLLSQTMTEADCGILVKSMPYTICQQLSRDCNSDIEPRHLRFEQHECGGHDFLDVTKLSVVGGDHYLRWTAVTTPTVPTFAISECAGRDLRGRGHLRLPSIEMDVLLSLRDIAPSGPCRLERRFKLQPQLPGLSLGRRGGS